MTEKHLKAMNLLRFIYGECRYEFVKLNLNKLIEEYEIPQVGNFNHFLIENRILGKTSSNEYKWIADGGPTVDMIENIFRCITEYWQKKKSADRKTLKSSGSEAKISTSKPKNVTDIPVIKKPSPPSSPKQINLKSVSKILVTDDELINELKLRGYTGRIEKNICITF